MSKSSNLPGDPQRLAEAALWRIRLKENDLATSDEFEAWLAADVRNAAEWQRVERAWNRVDGLEALPEMIDARRIALNHAQSHHQLATRFGGLRKKLIIAASVAAAIFIVIGITLFSGIWNATTFETAIGERRTITLQDGSNLTLDSGSRVSVRYSAKARNLTLLRGQARFDVAHNVNRPFTVKANTRKVVATGTAFNIDVSQAELRVTLLEGKALVVAETEGLGFKVDRDTPELHAGQQYVALPTQPPLIQEVNLDAVTAWESGQLVFDNERLAAIVARVSRYTSVKMVVGDAAAANLRVSGVFKTGDLDSFVDAVTHYLPVRAVHTGDSEIRFFHS